MSRPQIINPKDGKIIYLFSHDVENLLDEGYSIEDVLTFPILPTSPNIPLTGYEDLDLKIMMELDDKEISLLCGVNQYAAQLCKTKHFWIKKFNNENLPIPDVDNLLKAYQISILVNDITDQLRYEIIHQYTLKVNPKFGSDYFNVFIEKYKDNNQSIIKNSPTIKKIQIRYFPKSLKFFLMITTKMGEFYINVSLTELKDILFKMYYDGAIY